MVSDTELNPTQQEAEPEQSDAQSPPTDVEKGQKDAEIEMNISYEADQMDETDKAPPAATATTRPIKSIYDDFSLTSGSASGVRFRSHNVVREYKIYDQPNAQLILEEVEEEVEEGDSDMVREMKGERGIRIKQAYDTSYGLQFLRATYSLIAIFAGGFLLILGICILLFLFIDLATQLGYTNNQSVNGAGFVATCLSVPVFVYSLAMGMTLMTRFVVDTFYGHPFLRTFGLDVVVTDWIAFIMYLGIPVMTLISTLFMQKSDWWEISLLTWFCSVLIFWGLFSCCVLWYEVRGCLDLIVELEDELDENAHWLVKIRRAIVHGMMIRLSGTKLMYHKTVNDDDDNTEDSLDGKNRRPEGLLTLLTKQKCMSSVYNEVEPPKRIYTLDECRGSVSFVTRTSWSLEKLFCRKNGVLGAVPITAGEFGITRQQINSTLACRLLGVLLYVLIVAGVAVWFGLEGAPLGLLLFALFICCIVANVTTYRMLGVRQEVIDGKLVFHYWTKHQVTKPTVAFTWCFIGFSIIILYIIPLVYLVKAENTTSALVFGWFGVFSALRHYLNALVLLKEVGPNHFRRYHRHSDSFEWKKKHRFFQVAEVGSDTARSFWIYTFISCVVFFVFVVFLAMYDTKTGAIVDENYGYGLDEIQLMTDFGYTSQPNLPYPTCALKKGINTKFDQAGLSNFVFLAGLAYSYPNQTQLYLDQWFGENQVINDVDTVDQFKRAQSKQLFSDSAVSYRMFTFSEMRAVVSIRGTSTVWDLMADAQLWLPATLFQALRVVLPLGNIFTPILHHTVKFVSALESSSIEKVAFYKETADFVKYLKKRGYDVTVCGHSLGGGLALITGSQTETPAIGISAPNAMLSRDTFDPPVTIEQLNRLTFNVVPARDVVPMLDDKARLYQNINCTAAPDRFPDCHSKWRTLCEIQYSCGSYTRPVPCECVLDYNYPEPTYTGNGTASNFTQLCLEARDSV